MTSRTVRDLLADTGIPYLPELPARGPGADMIGRTAALLVEMPVDLQPSGWRFVDRPGRDQHRAEAFLREDLDELAETYDGYEGDLKLQVTGPWTLASAIAVSRGERSVADPGATRDLVESLAEGLRQHVETVQRLVPRANLVVQVDEPGLPAALAGRLATASGFGRLRAVDPQEARQGLRTVLETAGERTTVVHCCARDVPLPLLRATGAVAVAIDVSLLGPKGWESVAATVESGVRLWAGAMGTRGHGGDTGDDGDHGDGTAYARAGEVGKEVVTSWTRVGLPVRDLDTVVVTPACGLAGAAGFDEARAVQRTAVRVAKEWSERAHG
jgi:methionine synthase II (cobalamin-independent)